MLAWWMHPPRLARCTLAPAAWLRVTAAQDASNNEAMRERTNVEREVAELQDKVALREQVGIATPESRKTTGQ